jgi:hypothetical protein
MSTSKYNPHSTQLFKLESRNDASRHADMVDETRNAIHPEVAKADDESDASDDSDNDTES